MRASALVFLALYLVAAHASSLFMWSNVRFFNGKNIEVTEQISSDALKNALNGQGPLAKYVGDKTHTEAIVVFVEPESTQQTPTLNSNTGTFSQLRGSLGSGSSSMLLRQVAGQVAGAGLVLSLIQNLPSGATVTVARNAGSKLLTNLNGRPDIKFITLEQLKERKDNNGLTDLVVVVLDEPAADTVSSILRIIPGNYLAMLTTEAEIVQNDFVDAGSKLVEEVEAINDGVSWDSELIEAVIVMIPFVVILLVGVCCTCSVQSELKFDGEKKKMR